MPFSQYLADQTLNWFRGTTYTAAPGTNVYLSLHSQDPGVIGLNGDVTTTLAAGRAVIPVANFGAPSSVTAGGRQIANNASVTFTNSAAAPATITFFGLWDAASGGNFLAYGLLGQPVNVLTGDILEFPVGQLTIRGI
jgi:hypothetical protein